MNPPCPMGTPNLQLHIEQFLLWKKKRKTSLLLPTHWANEIKPKLKQVKEAETCSYHKPSF